MGHDQMVLIPKEEYEALVIKASGKSEKGGMNESESQQPPPPPPPPSPIAASSPIVEAAGHGEAFGRGKEQLAAIKVVPTRISASPPSKRINKSKKEKRPQDKYYKMW